MKARLSGPSLVWKLGMKKWESAGTVDELKNVFEQLPPPVPPAD